METTVIEQAWTKSKVLIKGLVIGFLVLLLLIPTLYVQNLIEERELRQKEAIAEVSSKWSGQQNITGPVVVLPYWEVIGNDNGKVTSVKRFAYFLPDALKINTAVTPQERSRGIYKVMLYTAQVNMSGKFSALKPEAIKIAPDKIIWNEAVVKMNVWDTKGLNDELKLKWNDTVLTLAPQSFTDPAQNGLAASIPLTGLADLREVSFSADININGSEQLLFTPVGKTTEVTVQSPWPHPSFTGNILPQTHSVKDSGFTAVWKSLAHKRAFPQQFTYVAADSGRSPTIAAMEEAAFGVDFFIPVNGYQKTMRSIKYAVLCILLTFAAFFIIETANKKSVHPFQYALIGLALVLFYILLLSFSEYIGFNLSYLIAATATIGLIGWFVKDVLGSGKLSGLLSVVLLMVYVYVFTILQLQDFALLFGSIGLFISLAVIMHFSKKAKW